MPDAPTNEYSRRTETVEGMTVGVTSYKVGTRYSARVDNIDPGAIIARAQGSTRIEAERDALENAALTLRLRDASQAMRRSAESLPTNREKK
jgi:hypothetical protein